MSILLFFQTCDILSLDVDMKNCFDVCLDKGTYDAISLNKDNSKMRTQYRQSVFDLLKTNADAIFFITSCNWTLDELTTFFSPMFKVKCVLPTPKFQFGGQSGSNVTSVVFEKVPQ